MSRLDEIRARVEAASEGPWEWKFTERGNKTVPEYLYSGSIPDPDDDYVKPIIETDGGYYGPSLEDADFIAHAREDIPWLLGCIEELIERGDAMHELLAAVCRRLSINLDEEEWRDFQKAYFKGQGMKWLKSTCRID